jgi:hypothetical protein
MLTVWLTLVVIGLGGLFLFWIWESFFSRGPRSNHYDPTPPDPDRAVRRRSISR